jgi:hypothetical protein
MIKMTNLAAAVLLGYGLFAPLCAQTAQARQKAMEA